MKTPIAEATRLGDLLHDAGFSAATAESMTGGALAEELVLVDGASEWLAGGVIAYQSRIKYELLGVVPGPVITSTAACQMAIGVARVLGTDVGIATTGCAGPEAMEDQPVGTLWVGVAVQGAGTAAHFHLTGDPQVVRDEAVRRALEVAGERLGSFVRS
jgi:PncC family amidohydrolase